MNFKGLKWYFFLGAKYWNYWKLSSADICIFSGNTPKRTTLVQIFPPVFHIDRSGSERIQKYRSRLPTWNIFEPPTHFSRSDSDEGCPGLVDYVMITIKKPFIKNEESTKDVFISWVNRIWKLH